MVLSVTTAKIVARLLKFAKQLRLKVNKINTQFNTLKHILQLRYLQSNTR